MNNLSYEDMVAGLPVDVAEPFARRTEALASDPVLTAILQTWMGRALPASAREEYEARARKVLEEAGLLDEEPE